ncbi:MAG: iron ABC transporter permease [Alphaproteobacteria bacterium]|nr:iron ABC transporter permease [Alphaproteobacteria bacterium]
MTPVAVVAAAPPMGTAVESFRRRVRRRATVIAVAAALVLAGVVADVSVGPGNFALDRVVEAILSPGSQGAKLHMIVWDLRMPVALAAVLIGAMLAIGGAQMQTILDNPLAEPFTLGLAAAASFGAALAIVAGAGLWPAVGASIVAAHAFGFALLASLLLFAVSRWRGGGTSMIVMVGIAIMFTFNALLAFLEYGASEVKLQQIVFWIMGSLQRATWPKLAVCALVLAGGLGWSILRAWPLTALRLGETRALSLGVPVTRLRLEALFVVSMLAATAVAFVGTIGFVGLVGPHVARLLIGEDQRMLVPLSALIGAGVLSFASILSKTITPGVIYPIGMITSLIGIPVFLAIVFGRRARLAAS